MPGLPERAAAEGLTPLAYMRRYGAFEVRRGRRARSTRSRCPRTSSTTSPSTSCGRVVHARAEAGRAQHRPDCPRPSATTTGRRPVGRARSTAIVRRGFPTPERASSSSTPRTLADWGWPEQAHARRTSSSHVHPAELAAGRDGPHLDLPAAGADPHPRRNAKWLDEIAHTNPLWIHPQDAAAWALAGDDLVRVETEIGHFVVKAWVTEGIRPGVVACSHHMGRWKLGEPAASGRRWRPVRLDRDEATRWATVARRAGVRPVRLAPTPTPPRIWWTDVGVHQNLTFPVHPDPISGQHCWHQAVRVRKAEAG